MDHEFKIISNKIVLNYLMTNLPYAYNIQEKSGLIVPRCLVIFLVERFNLEDHIVWNAFKVMISTKHSEMLQDLQFYHHKVYE